MLPVDRIDMEVYLIRHTAPAVEKGVCYGQADVDVSATFEVEAAKITKTLPSTIEVVFSSPLQRCTQLAVKVSEVVHRDDRLMEMDFGTWEMRRWEDIPRRETDPWMAGFVNEKPPGGESFNELSERVREWWSDVRQKNYRQIAVVTHAGVIRAFRSHVLNLPLKEGFEGFDIPYGEIFMFDPDYAPGVLLRP